MATARALGRRTLTAEVVFFDLFMVLTKCGDGQGENFLRCQIIIPHLVPEPGLLTKNVLMGNPMRRVEPADVNPLPAVQNNQND